MGLKYYLHELKTDGVKISNKSILCGTTEEDALKYIAENFEVVARDSVKNTLLIMTDNGDLDSYQFHCMDDALFDCLDEGLSNEGKFSVGLYAALSCWDAVKKLDGFTRLIYTEDLLDLGGVRDLLDTLRSKDLGLVQDVGNTVCSTDDAECSAEDCACNSGCCCKGLGRRLFVD